MAESRDPTDLIFDLLVKELLLQSRGDETAFKQAAVEFIRRLKAQPDEKFEEVSAITSVREALRELPDDVGLDMIEFARKRYLASQVQTDVPIVSAVFTMSLIWATGHRLDNIIVPNATVERPSLTFAQLAREVPTAITNVLHGIYEQGVEEVRKNDAYLMDSPRFEKLMDVLQEFVDTQSDDEKAKYSAIMDRMRMLMQVMTEADLKVS